MKRVIGGVAYNTDTATKVAGCRIKDNDRDHRTLTLYLTRGGAFFIHVHEVYFDDQDVGIWEKCEDVSLSPITRDKAQKLIFEGDVEIFHDVFTEPPDSEAPREEPEATIFLRVPTILKRQIEEEAGKARQSVNAWAMRCLEQCLGDSRREQEDARRINEELPEN